MLQRLVVYYGIVSLATTLFFWVFTLIGFRNIELREHARKNGLSLFASLLLGLRLGLIWPKSMVGLLLSMRRER